MNKSGEFQVTKISAKSFAEEINAMMKEVVNGSLLFYIPDKDMEIREVFKHCERLQRDIAGGNVTVVPCVYTSPYDSAHFTLLPGRN